MVGRGSHGVEQMQLLLLRVGVTLPRVHPQHAAHVLRRKDHLLPVAPALCIALVGGRIAERQAETDDETEDGEQNVVDADCGPS